jgi:alpha-N-arabinofuranosidase
MAFHPGMRTKRVIPTLGVAVFKSAPFYPMHRLKLFPSCLILLALTLGFGASARADLIVYDDALGAGWFSNGWGSTVDLASTAVVHTGTNSIAATVGAWSALALGHNALDTTPYGKVTFWINGGPVGGQKLHISGTLNYSGQPGVDIPLLTANTWQQISIPLASLGVDNKTNFTGLWFQEFSGSAQPVFYVDDVALAPSVPTIPAPPLNGGMALYDDAFTNGWQNWSWATINSAATSPVNSGVSSIAVTSGPNQAVRFHHAALDSVNFSSLTFWINGGSTGGQKLTLNALLSGVAQPGVPIGPLVANTWQKIVVPLADLGVANKPDLTDFWLQESGGLTIPTYYVDDVRLDLAPPPSTVNVSVHGSQGIREVDPRMFGLNTAIWDGSFNTATTADLLNEVDNQALRFPGGSASDAYHWQTNTSEGQTFQWATNFDAFANIAVTTKAQVFITVNYGTGTPEEAAAWVKYSNKTKDYGFKYWEVGNENYGTWEADKNTRPNDPVTYATRFKEYSRKMKAMDSSIKIGAVILADEDGQSNYTDETVTNPRTGATHHGWSAVMLATFKQLHFFPDFVIYHRYEQGPGGENDLFLLNSSKSWGNDAASIRQMLNDYMGSDAKRIQIDCTENNSVYGNPGKQTTSLVNGLFMADSLGNIMKTEFRSFFWWDLRNGVETGNNNSPSLYGWRKYGDYGIVNYNVPAAPADRYPTFYVYKLLTHYARGGETVVNASSDYNLLGVYAVRDHHSKTLNVLIINKHPNATLNVNLSVDGFKVSPHAKVFSYGIPQDEAARTGTGSADVTQATATLAGQAFTYAPAPYSATVIQISPPDTDGDDN